MSIFRYVSTSYGSSSSGISTLLPLAKTPVAAHPRKPPRKIADNRQCIPKKKSKFIAVRNYLSPPIAMSTKVILLFPVAVNLIWRSGFVKAVSFIVVERHLSFVILLGDTFVRIFFRDYYKALNTNFRRNLCRSSSSDTAMVEFTIEPVIYFGRKKLSLYSKYQLDQNVNNTFSPHFNYEKKNMRLY